MFNDIFISLARETTINPIRAASRCWRLEFCSLSKGRAYSGAGMAIPYELIDGKAALNRPTFESTFVVPVGYYPGNAEQPEYSD